jgi:crotonobetainyl-CoA:carnitine CoA-transferase CaiB-like acyl-CoA transferase
MELCAANSVPAMIAHAARDILDDPQLKQTLFEERVHETEGRYRAMKPGIRFSRTPASIRLEPPDVGRDTLEILSELGEDGVEAAQAHGAQK